MVQIEQRAVFTRFPCVHGVKTLKYSTYMAWFQSAGGEQCGQGDGGDTGNSESGRSIGVAHKGGEEVGDVRRNVLVEIKLTSQGRRRRHLCHGIMMEDQMVE